MNANELRIGNFVNVPRADQSPFRIDAFESLSNKFIKVAMIHPEYGENFHPLTWYGNDLNPIPLTEEWLLRFGFEHREFSFDKGSFFLSKRTGKNEYLYQAHTNRFQVKYVHQLQNLYFAVKGTELTYETVS